MIVACSVKNCMNVERLANHREKDPIRETLRENAPHIALATDDAKQFRILLRTMRRREYLVDQLLAESGSMRLVPGCGLNDIFHRLWAEDHNHREFRRRETSAFS
jgi:hypothetical protein